MSLALLLPLAFAETAETGDTAWERPEWAETASADTVYVQEAAEGCGGGASMLLAPGGLLLLAFAPRRHRVSPERWRRALPRREPVG